MFFALLVSSLALAIGLAIYDLVTRELDLSLVTAQSQYAIYAADTGAECALYWDNKMAPPLNGAPSAFGTSSASTWPSSGVICNGQDIAVQPNGWQVLSAPTAATTTFTLTFGAQPYCAKVAVAKWFVSGIERTIVYSEGYNTCVVGAPNRLERELKVSF